MIPIPPEMPTVEQVRDYLIPTGKELKLSEYPCPGCKTQGCEVCKQSGLVSRFRFMRYYTKLRANRNELQKQYEEYLDREAEADTCYYDLGGVINSMNRNIFNRF